MFLIITPICLTIKIKIFKYNIVHALMYLYLFCGLFYVLVWSLLGANINSLLFMYKNHFFPFILYHFVFNMLNYDIATRKILKILNFIFIIGITSVCFEYLYLKILNNSPYDIPWYEIVFKYDDRYIGSIGEKYGYILPEQTPILGLLGFPHATAAFIVGLTGFSIFKLIGNKKFQFSLNQKFINLFIMFFVIVITFIILKVKTQMVILIFLCTFLPMIFKKRNLFIIFILLAVTISFFVSEQLYINSILNSFSEGFLYTNTRESSFSAIISKNPITTLFNQPLLNILFGSPAGITEGSELRLLNFTLQFGIIWLILFISIVVNVLKNTYKKINSNIIGFYEIYSMFVLFVFTFVGFLDTGHYARIMWFPLIDVFVILIAISNSYQVNNIKN